MNICLFLFIIRGGFIIAMKQKITFNTILQIDQDQFYSEIDGEVVMLNIQNGEYYYLNQSGSFIWNLLNKPCSYRQLIDDLLASYDISEETCVNDTILLLEELLKKGLVKVIK